MLTGSELSRSSESVDIRLKSLRQNEWFVSCRRGEGARIKRRSIQNRAGELSATCLVLVNHIQHSPEGQNPLKPQITAVSVVPISNVTLFQQHQTFTSEYAVIHADPRFFWLL